MKAVLDTNVLAYALLGTEGFAPLALRVMQQVQRPMAPAHWEAEIANVIWMAARQDVLPAAMAPSILRVSRKLDIQSVPIGPLGSGALLKAFRSGLPAYDTLFVELAAQEDCPLLTFDKGILRAFPEQSLHPADFLAEAAAG